MGHPVYLDNILCKFCANFYLKIPAAFIQIFSRLKSSQKSRKIKKYKFDILNISSIIQHVQRVTDSDLFQKFSFMHLSIYHTSLNFILKGPNT